MADRPVFLLGVGAQKCGTSWLYEQLARQSAVMMSPIKELHYWDRRFRPDFFKPRDNAGTVKRLARRAGNRLTAKPAFQRVAMDCDEAYYLAFFQARLRPHHRVIGEITPSYSILSSAEFAYIRDFLPFPTKVVFLMRDPVERIWSQCKMQAKKGRNRGKSDDPYERFAKSVDRVKFIDRTDYASTVAALQTAFPREDIFFGFYETLFQQSEVDRLSRFVGVEGLDFDLRANPNKSADLPKPVAAAWNRVRDRFAGVYAFVRSEFGEQVPDTWSG